MTRMQCDGSVEMLASTFGRPADLLQEAMPAGPHILSLLEEALSESFSYHNQLDAFVVRVGISLARLGAARARAELRRGKWASAPKRIVAQEVLSEIGTGTGDDDRLVAEFVTAFCRGSFAGASPKGLAAIGALKAELAQDSKAAAERREQACREQDTAQRLRDKAGEVKTGNRLAFKQRFFEMCAADDMPQARGYALERLLNEFLDFEGLHPRGSFKIIGEQIDGSFTWSGHTSLVEAKWTSAMIDGSGFGAFDWKIGGKTANTRGLFIAINGYTEQAITALNGKGSLRFICLDGAHLLRSFDFGLSNLLDVVWRHADETGEAYLPVSSPHFILKSG